MTSKTSTEGESGVVVREHGLQLRLLVEESPVAMGILSRDGTIEYVNQAFEKLVGYSADELIALTYPDLTPEKWHAKESAIVEEQVLKRGYSEVYEKEYRSKDGTIVPVELHAFLIRDADGKPDGMWAMVRDVSEHKRFERELHEANAILEKRVEERTAALRESESRFRQLAEATLEGIAVTEDGIFIDANTQLAAMLGWDFDELIGRPVEELIAPHSRELVERRRTEGYEGRYECDALHKDGSTFPCEVCGRSIDWQGRLVRITVVRDLTETKRAEAELEAHQAELARARRVALRSEISAGVVHQIGQPITSIGNNVAAARAAVEACCVKDCGVDRTLRSVEAELRRVRTTMAHLQALAHPGRQSRAPADLNALVEETLALVRAGADCPDDCIELDLHPDLPVVSADPVQMVQAIGNLIQNACEAVATRPPLTCALTIATRACGDASLELTVTDSGPGIAPDELDRLFEPFFTTKERGSGIGLSLARRVVEAHGGRLEGFNNPDGPGATFRITLPVERSAP